MASEDNKTYSFSLSSQMILGLIVTFLPVLGGAAYTGITFWAKMNKTIEAVDKSPLKGKVKFVSDGLYPPTIEIMQKPDNPIVGETLHRGWAASAIGLYTAYLAATGQSDPDLEHLRRAVAYGSIVASFNVEEFGTERVQRLTRDEVEERVAAFHAMTSFTLI